MNAELFDYAFPKELVAQHPPARREEARMMVLDRVQKTWIHHRFPDMHNFLKRGDVLVVNNALADLVEKDGRLVPALPPYIKRKRAADFTPEDFERYRSVYASAAGSKAAPTAGFHFTNEILEDFKRQNILIKTITLHVSEDTFKPIRSERIEDHPMHGETYEIPDETATAIRTAKSEGRRVVAVGTTTVRALESWKNFFEATGPNRTDLFITPGYQFQIVDALLTNFHRPRSTVLVMVSAFAGREFIQQAYEEAIRERYRLFSYGDCMLII